MFAGRLGVDVKYGDKPVPGSPFRVRAGPPYDASKVKVSGPGVQKAGIVAEEITKAVVDTTEAGIADLSGSLTIVKGFEFTFLVFFHFITLVYLLSYTVLTLYINTLSFLFSFPGNAIRKEN